MKIVIRNKISQKLDEHKTKTGVAKTWTASKLNMATQSMYTIAKSTNISIITLIKFSYVLNCSINDLLDYEVIDDGKDEWTIEQHD